MIRKLTAMLAVLAATLLAGWGVGTADAAPRSIPIGGGSGIIVPKGGNSAAACTLTAIGHSGGKLVGLTAGHCGTPGQKVYSETFIDRGEVGTITYSTDDLDMAIIEFNHRAAPLRTVRGATITGINRNQPAFPSIVCKEGRTTGNTCGVTWFSDRGEHVTQMCVIEGDSGAPVISGNKLVGMVNAYYFFGCIGPETGTNIGPILDRMAQVGYPGFRVV